MTAQPFGKLVDDLTDALGDMMRDLCDRDSGEYYRVKSALERLERAQRRVQLERRDLYDVGAMMIRASDASTPEAGALWFLAALISERCE